ncbi:MAG: hypothetical protein F6K11_26900 [Leptolyngbya sp. SIO3F4]|nr:hypothetical protein [Leptolyngbya sp. SIO3F4]
MLVKYTLLTSDELRIIIEGEAPSEVKEMDDADGFLRVAKNLPRKEIIRLTHLLIDYLKDPPI